MADTKYLIYHKSVNTPMKVKQKMSLPFDSEWKQDIILKLHVLHHLKCQHFPTYKCHHFLCLPIFVVSDIAWKWQNWFENEWSQMSFSYLTLSSVIRSLKTLGRDQPVEGYLQVKPLYLCHDSWTHRRKFSTQKHAVFQILPLFVDEKLHIYKMWFYI